MLRFGIMKIREVRCHIALEPLHLLNVPRDRRKKDLRSVTTGGVRSLLLSRISAPKGRTRKCEDSGLVKLYSHGNTSAEFGSYIKGGVHDLMR